ncbi:MAG: uridine kinase [Oligoflexus sp.]
MTSPFMVAVSGGSGSGKTTFVRMLQEKLQNHDPLVISIDHYYQDLSHLTPEERVRQNFDDPSAIEKDLLREQISLLRRGIPVERPIYDYATHTRRPGSVTLKPSSLIILDGIFSLCYHELLQLLDLKLFIDVDDDIRVVRRVGRDMAERGRSFDSCVQQYLGTVKAMHQKYIEPTKKHADYIIPWHQTNHKALNYTAGLLATELNRMHLSAY